MKRLAALVLSLVVMLSGCARTAPQPPAVSSAGSSAPGQDQAFPDLYPMTLIDQGAGRLSSPGGSA